MTFGTAPYILYQGERYNSQMDYEDRGLIYRGKMKTNLITIQYLENSPEISQLDLNLVVHKLRSAAERLPFTHLLIGWQVPMSLLEACRKEAERLGIRFLRWQPLLTDDGVLQPHPDWQTQGLTGHKVAGYHGLPEFTFVCPNHPDVHEAVVTHLDHLVRQGMYQGFFLDRVRFPSPSSDPINDLGCFCEYCQHTAALVGLDLGQIRADILAQTKEQKGRLSLIQSLLSGKTDPVHSIQWQAVSQWLAFREWSVCDFLATISQPLREAGLEIGLDCFSPSLTHIVGQDLHGMSGLVDWIKLMTYAHTLGPAGIPFELSGLFHYLTSTTYLNEGEALDFIGQAIELPLPSGLRALEKDGLSSLALEKEVRVGVEACSVPTLAGMELVELEGVTSLKPEQIRSDLIAVKKSGAAGLALSWDLLHISLERLDQVRQVYLEDKLPQESS
jgi:hypothetical protein